MGPAGGAPYLWCVWRTVSGSLTSGLICETFFRILALPLVAALLLAPQRAPAQINITIRLGTPVMVMNYSSDYYGDSRTNYVQWRPVTVYYFHGPVLPEVGAGQPPGDDLSPGQSPTSCHRRNRRGRSAATSAFNTTRADRGGPPPCAAAKGERWPRPGPGRLFVGPRARSCSARLRPGHAQGPREVSRPFWRVGAAATPVVGRERHRERPGVADDNPGCP